MNPEVKEKWVAALRSGAFRKGTGILHRVGVPNPEDGSPNPHGDTYCCLGVLCVLAERAGIVESTKDSGQLGDSVAYTDTGEDWREYGQTTFLPRAVKVWAGLDDASPEVRTTGGRETLAALNDTVYGDFGPIATLIESQL